MMELKSIESRDFVLGIPGFNYSDLFDAARLKDLADAFYAEVADKEPILHDALSKYIATHGRGIERRVESKILTDAAPYLSNFVARLFGIKEAMAEVESAVLVQNPVWQYKFFVQRRATKAFKADAVGQFNEAELWEAVLELRNNAFDQTMVRDEELSIATMTALLVKAEEALTKETELDRKQNER
ncbi:MAG: hypothetical protein IPP63_07625 [Chloracidobacterium sp.]|nr:hypothetical protein [Chloracidobacterium sp.]